MSAKLRPNPAHRSVSSHWLLPPGGWVIAVIAGLVIGGCVVVPTDVPPTGDDQMAPQPEQPTAEVAAGAIPTERIGEAIEGFNQDLRQRGFDWEAGVGPNTFLTPDELELRTGLLLDGEAFYGDAADHPWAFAPNAPHGRLEVAGAVQVRQMLLPELQLPEALDYRSVGTPVRDQGLCGTCWAFATIGALEANIRRADRGVGSDLDLSEQRLASCLVGSCAGFWIEPTLRYLKDDGTVREACNPYTATGNPSLCPLMCAEPPQRIRDGDLAVTPRNVCSDRPDARDESWNWQLARQLRERGPLIAVMSVPEEFGRYYSKGIYRYAGLLPVEQPAGCHAVVLMGYNAGERSWLFKNSWSTGWGEEGYGRVSWDDTRAHMAGAAFWLEPLMPTPTMPPYPGPSPTATPEPPQPTEPPTQAPTEIPPTSPPPTQWPTTTPLPTDPPPTATSDGYPYPRP